LKLPCRAKLIALQSVAIAKICHNCHTSLMMMMMMMTMTVTMMVTVTVMVVMMMMMVMMKNGGRE
jgi:hypothetical protein